MIIPIKIRVENQKKNPPKNPPCYKKIHPAIKKSAKMRIILFYKFSVVSLTLNFFLVSSDKVYFLKYSYPRFYAVSVCLYRFAARFMQGLFIRREFAEYSYIART